MRSTPGDPVTAPVLFLVGPTASGKSDVAVALAARLGGEIVSADSMQVYRGLDILSAKPGPALRARVPHHLLDVAEPWERFDAARYARLTKAAVERIRGRGRTAIVAGGAGMYVRALADGLFEGAGRDDALRERLERLADASGEEALHRRLQAVDPAAAARIHPHDRRRIVRALEVFEACGRPISSLQREWGRGGGKVVPGAAWFSPTLACACVFFGLRRGREDLARRIEARTRAMLAAGAVAEARALSSRSGGAGATILQSLGLKEFAGVIEGGCGVDEAAETIARATRAYARRQYGWFTRDPRILWIDVASDEAAAETAGRILGRLDSAR